MIKGSKAFLLFVSLLPIMLLLGCGPNEESRYDSGYSDGYAEGYNTECEIRSTLVAGNWDDEAYSRGYKNGRADGIVACRNERRN